MAATSLEREIRGVLNANHGYTEPISLRRLRTWRQSKEYGALPYWLRSAIDKALGDRQLPSR